MPGAVKVCSQGESLRVPSFFAGGVQGPYCFGQYDGSTAGRGSQWTAVPSPKSTLHSWSGAASGSVPFTVKVTFSPALAVCGPFTAPVMGWFGSGGGSQENGPQAGS